MRERSYDRDDSKFFSRPAGEGDQSPTGPRRAWPEDRRRTWWVKVAPSSPPPPMRATGPPEDGLCETDPDGFGAFAALGDIDHYTLALIEGGDPGSLEH